MADQPPPGSMVSPQWAQWRRQIDIDAYEERFTAIESSGHTAHGEADFVEALGPRSVLDAGCGTGRVAIELARRGIEVVGVDLDPDMIDRARGKAPAVRFEVGDLATFDLGRRFDVVVMAGNVLLFCRPADQAAIVGRLAAHLDQERGRLVAGFSLGDRVGLPGYDAMAGGAGLVLVERWATWSREPFTGGSYAVSVHGPV
jgi:SAM-dependent methyltransferase